MIILGNSGFVSPSFSLRNRLRRGLWNVIDVLFFRYSPRPFHKWRAFVLRCFGAKLGCSVHIYPGVRIWAPWELEVGDYVGIADGAIVYNIAKVKLANHCVVSQGAHLCTGSHDIDSRNFQLIALPISIMDYVWVCAGAFVGPGVTIAAGSVIAAHAVVVKSVSASWKVWAGNPAVLKGNRSDVIKESSE
jgi:putative colanic acid biosynthesis acetyltransferase WcaF